MRLRGEKEKLRAGWQGNRFRGDPLRKGQSWNGTSGVIPGEEINIRAQREKDEEKNGSEPLRKKIGHWEGGSERGGRAYEGEHHS